jgi:short-subunit dehydrogenase
VTDRASFSAFLDGAEAQLGPVDVLVNNAGIMQIGPFVDEDDLTARRMVDINLHGVILGTKLALERMIPRDRGHIVNISSQAGKFGSPGGATYSATKHAVVGLSEAVRGELRLMDAHVDISYVMPYVVNTDLGGGLGDARGLRNLEPSEVADAIVDALRNVVVDVWVPKSAKRTNTVTVLLPRRLAEGMARAIKADRVLTSADALRRREYELRASRSAPGLEAPSEQPRIAETVGD